jgi:hypothetical protein
LIEAIVTHTLLSSHHPSMLVDNELATGTAPNASNHQRMIDLAATNARFSLRERQRSHSTETKGDTKDTISSSTVDILPTQVIHTGSKPVVRGWVSLNEITIGPYGDWSRINRMIRSAATGWQHILFYHDPEPLIVQCSGT